MPAVSASRVADRERRYPVFSHAVDADPRTQKWLASLSDRERRALRDGIDHLWKEIPAASVDTLGARERRGDDEPSAPGLSHAQLGTLRALFLAAGADALAPWQKRCFDVFITGANTVAVARQLGCSRSTVRAAIEGHAKKRGREVGAIEIIAAAVTADPELAAKVQAAAEPEPDVRPRALVFFKGLDSKPAMVVPMAMLLVVADLVDSRREVPVADLLPYWPRGLISECMRLLRAHGWASSDGHKIKVHRLPTDEATP